MFVFYKCASDHHESIARLDTVVSLLEQPGRAILCRGLHRVLGWGHSCGVRGCVYCRVSWNAGVVPEIHVAMSLDSARGLVGGCGGYMKCASWSSLLISGEEEFSWILTGELSFWAEWEK